MSEEWRDIVGYEGLYQVSNLGRFRSLDRYVWSGRHNKYIKRRGIVLVTHLNKYGYMQISLNKEGIRKTHKAHSLVAEAFIPNPDNLPCVNHKNEIKNDNRIENLEWCTVKYNTNYGTAIARRAKKLCIPILQFDLDGNFIREWSSATEAQKKLGIDRSQICDACKGQQKTCHNYIWKYKNVA